METTTSFGTKQSERLSFQQASTDPCFSLVINWMQLFLSSPHASLGRPGDVCPFVRTALSKNAIEFYRNTSEDIDSFEEDIRAHFADFNAGDRTDIYRSRIVLPTRLKQPDAAVEIVQRRLKPMFVEKHLMIGQFYETCEEPGLWNENFRPLQTPVPLLAMRSMVPTDIAFLHYDRSYLEAYLENFGNRGVMALRQFETMKEAAKAKPDILRLCNDNP